jgi:hypothetical protein
LTFRELKKSLGVEGSIEVETEAILIENGIDFSDFEEKVSLVFRRLFIV